MGSRWGGAMITGLTALGASVSWTQQTALTIGDGALTMSAMGPTQRSKEIPLSACRMVTLWGAGTTRK